MSALSCGCDPDTVPPHVCAACTEKQVADNRHRQPFIYPCGCSKHKVNAGLCDHYKPGELPT